MKKSTLAAILYYFVLLGGFLLFIGFIMIGRIYYSDEIQNLFDSYPYIIFPVLIIYFVGYLYAIKTIASTKAFQEFEKECLCRKEKNKEKYKKIFRIVLIIWGIFEAVHIPTNVYFIYSIRNGNKINILLDYWSSYSWVTIVFFIISIYYYNKQYKK